jgi:hypothetical protein
VNAPGAKETPKAGAPKTLSENTSTQGPERDPALDTEWCAERAAVAMRYLAEHYPECEGSEALHPHQDAAHEAAVSGNGEAYIEALRSYCRAGRDEALRIRKGAA